MKSRRRESRLARVQDFMAQQRFPKARWQEVDQPLQRVWDVSGGVLSRGQKSPRVLTYHEIPLLTLDWSSAKACAWGGAQTDDLWAGRTSNPGEAAVDSSGEASTPGSLSSVTGKASDAGASVCDVWQAFLNGSPCGDHPGVFEAEWLQTAAAVSPSAGLGGLSSCVSAPGTLTGVALNRAGGTRVSRSRPVSKCPADRADESHKVMPEQAPVVRIERTGEESPTPGGSKGSKTTESRIADAEGETSDGASQEAERPIGEGLGTIQQRAGDQQQAGKALQIHRGEHSRVPEPAQKPEEVEEEEEEEERQEDPQVTQMQEDVGFGGQGSVLVHEEGQCPAPAERTKKEEEVNSVTHTSPESQKLSQDDGETIRPLPNKEESQKQVTSSNTKKETSGRMGEDMNLRGGAKEQRELPGHAGAPPQGEEGNTSSRVDAGERSAGAGSSPAAEYEGTRDVDVMESEIITTFGEDLVWTIWKEVFKTPKNDLKAEGRADTTDAASRAALPQEELGSGALSPSALLPRPSQSLESRSPEDGSQSLPSTGRALPGPSAEQERCPLVAAEQEAAQQDSFNPAEAPSSEEPHSLVWWSVFYALSHISRLTAFSGVVVGLFLYFFLCDFPAFFAVYLFSLCCWFYKWKRGQVGKVQGMEGWNAPCVQTGEML